MARPDKPRCRRLCDAAWVAIAAEFKLTPHEEQVARHLIAGAAVREIARLLGITVSALRSEVRVIYSKGQVTRREKFHAKVFEFYRNWVRTDPPRECQ